MSGYWLALSGALLSTALAQLFYKLYFRDRRNGLLVLSIGCFVSASVFAYLALKGLSLGMVYMSTALTQLLVMGLAHFVLGERITRDHGVAMGLIVSGIIIYAI